MPTEHSHLLNSRACRKAAVKDKEAKAKAKATKKKTACPEEQVRLELARPPRAYVSSRDDDFTGSIPSFESRRKVKEVKEVNRFMTPFSFSTSQTESLHSIKVKDQDKRESKRCSWIYRPVSLIALTSSIWKEVNRSVTSIPSLYFPD